MVGEALWFVGGSNNTADNTHKNFAKHEWIVVARLTVGAFAGSLKMRYIRLVFVSMAA